MSRVLIAGCQEHSLGDAVAVALRDRGHEVVTVGVSMQEDYTMDLSSVGLSLISSMLRNINPDHIVCTVGINVPKNPTKTDPFYWYREHMDVNVIAPMRLLAAWKQGISARLNVRHFVAISSNSATLPRTQSAAYCASKAALSQALRVEAREAVGGDYGYIVYGYEPGWLNGTLMSNVIQERFGPAVPMHRMRGVDLANGVRTTALAEQIVAGLEVPGAALNGTLVRYDGGEL